MTGEQLTRFIDMLYDLMEDFKERSPEHDGEIKEKLHSITILDKLSEVDREKNPQEDIPSAMANYALSIIHKVLGSNSTTKHIDYSPMYGLIAKYGLKLSNVCEYLGITSNVRTSISKNETVHMDILIQIAGFLECEPGDLYTFIDSEEKSRRDMKELMVKDSKSTQYKGKEMPIPTAILKELKDTESNDLISYLHIVPKDLSYKWINNMVISENTDHKIELDHSYPKGLYVTNPKTLSDNSELKKMIERLVLNAAKNLVDDKDKDDQNKDDQNKED